MGKIGNEADMNIYDCTKDILEHKEKVLYWMRRFWTQIEGRAKYHDDSKLKNKAEKNMFDIWTPELKKREFGSPEYKEALIQMGEGLKMHYQANRHHPEHYENGIEGMTLVDIIEMVSDWIAAASARGTYVDLDKAAERFGISEQLVRIIANQLREEDIWNQTENVPVPTLCPPNRRDGRIEGFTK